jgi:1-acyl-sn-glycerol-3-phosphate acyltransferase
MQEKYTVPLHIQISRRLLRFIFRIVFHLLGRVELHGMDRIPADKRYVLIFNHVSLVEVPFIAAYWPVILEIIGAAAVWERSGQNLIAKMWSGIQVKRYEFDRKVFNQVNQVLESGQPLMIAPEGGRSHQPGLRRGKPGVAYIVDQADIPVLPVGVVGNTIDFVTRGLKGKRPPLQMFVGEPFRVPPIQGRGEERRIMRQQNTDYMMAKLAALLPESYRGVYSQYNKILEGEEVSFDST